MTEGIADDVVDAIKEIGYVRQQLLMGNPMGPEVNQAINKLDRLMGGLIASPRVCTPNEAIKAAYILFPVAGRSCH